MGKLPADMRRALDYLGQLLPSTYGLRSDSLERLGTLLGDLDDQVSAVAGVGSSLQRVRYVDPNTTLATADQRGTITQPWATRQQAMDYIGAQAGGQVDWVVVLAGSDAVACTVPAGRNLVFTSGTGVHWAMGATTWTIAGALSTLAIRDLTYGQVTVVEGTTPTQAVLLIENSGGSAGISRASGSAQVFTVISGAMAPSASPSDDSSYLTGAYSVGGASGQLIALNTKFAAAVTAGQLIATGCQLLGNVTASGTAISLAECVIGATIVLAFSGSAGNLRLDSLSTNNLLEAAATISNGTRTYNTDKLLRYRASGAIVRGNPLMQATTAQRVAVLGSGAASVAAFVGWAAEAAADGEWFDVAEEGLAALFSSLNVNPGGSDSSEVYIAAGGTGPVIKSAIPASTYYRRCGTVFSPDTMLLSRGDVNLSAGP